MTITRISSYVVASLFILHANVAGITNQADQATSHGLEFEGIKHNYKLTFPKNWTLFTPLDAGKLPPHLLNNFIRLKLSAIAVSPDNISNISLAVTSDEFNVSEMTVPDDPRVQKIRTGIQTIKGREWFIEEVLFGRTINEKFSPMTRSYTTATKYKNGTIRLTFTFLFWAEDHREIVDNVLTSYVE